MFRRAVAGTIVLDSRLWGCQRIPVLRRRTIFKARPCKNDLQLSHFSQRLNFSTSSPAGSIFGFWGKETPAVETPLEKTYQFGAENVSQSVIDSSITQDADFGQNVAVAGDSFADFEGGTELMTDTAGVAADVAPTFAELGLGGSILPNRLFQDILGYLHDTGGLDWCPAIAILTVILRTLAVPAYIGIRAFSARSANVFPETHRLQQELYRARMEGNQFVAKKVGLEYMDHMKRHNINPMKTMLYQLPNGIVFMSMFMALRGMCQAQVPSMVDGGILWFTNLTIPDPYMLLPVVSCLSMSAIIKLGAADAELGPMANMSGVRKIIMWIPILSIPVLVFQPSAMFTFWVVSNIFTLALTTLFRNKALKKFLGIPEYVKHDKSIMDKMSASMNPMKIFEDMKKHKKDAERAKKLLNKLEEHKRMVERLKEMQKREKQG